MKRLALLVFWLWLALAFAFFSEGCVMVSCGKCKPCPDQEPDRTPPPAIMVGR